MSVILYIAARTDLNSMNPGKLAAQVSHAASLAAFHYKKDSGYAGTLYRSWEDEAGGFGTVLVLDGGKGDAFKESYQAVSQLHSLVGMVNDPTYPVRDGQYTHYVSIDTCWFALVDTEHTNKGAIEVLKQLPLHR